MLDALVNCELSYVFHNRPSNIRSDESAILFLRLASIFSVRVNEHQLQKQIQQNNTLRTIS